MIDKEGEKSVKLDLVPVGSWDGWLVVTERRAKEESAKEPPFNSKLEPF